MRLVVQRVSSARVAVGGEVIAAIGPGLLALVGIGLNDDLAKAQAAAAKIAGLRIFSDDQGKMNRSLTDLGGSVLVVSQFTLLGDASRGRRPSFAAAAPPAAAETVVAALAQALRSRGLQVAEGRFGADMQVTLVNDGPVTLVIDL